MVVLKSWNFLKEPAIMPSIKAEIKAIPKPINVLNKVQPILMYIAGLVNSSPSLANVSIGVGKTKFPYPWLIEIKNQRTKTKNMP